MRSAVLAGERRSCDGEATRLIISDIIKRFVNLQRDNINICIYRIYLNKLFLHFAGEVYCSIIFAVLGVFNAETRRLKRHYVQWDNNRVVIQSPSNLFNVEYGQKLSFNTISFRPAGII